MHQNRKLLSIALAVVIAAIASLAVVLLLDHHKAGISTSQAPQPRPAIQAPAPPTTVPAPSAPPVVPPKIATTPTAPAPATPEYPPQSRFDGRTAGNAAKDIDGEIVGAINPNGMVALTFDAGASAEPTPPLLDALKAAGLHVTFFLTGKWCKENPELVKRIIAEGHEIGNHTYSHPDLRKLSDVEIADQIRRMNEQMTLATGTSCKPLFRPPFGAFDKRVGEVVSKEGYGVIRWSVDSWDAFKKGITKDEIEARVLEKIKPGSIVLMHCGSQPTADALPDMIAKIQAKGLRVVTVSELISSNPPQTK